MPIAAVLFDLDDTLLWDERSVEEAFEVTCQAGAAETGVDAGALWPRCVKKQEHCMNPMILLLLPK